MSSYSPDAGWPNTVNRLQGHTYLPRLLNADSTVLDLGANRGLFAHGMIDKYGCRVFSLEPVASLRESIQPSARLTLLPLAVGGKNERRDIHVFKSRCASLLDAKSLWDQKKDGAVKEVEETEVVDFHTLWERIGVDKVDLMKVDIEGAELDLFASASDEDLQRCTQITVEFHSFLYPEQKPRIEAAKQRLRAAGFKAIDFTLQDLDVLFVNTAAGHVGPLQYLMLKYPVRYARGLSRRMNEYWHSRTA